MARRTVGADDREVLQMRVEMGLLQMEIDGRPDGEHPQGSDTYYEYLLLQAESEDGEFELTEDHCEEIDREFVQFYHRRICWLALREFAKARRDADHTLALMDFSTAHAPNQDWLVSHEQYRPFVLFHRAQAAALAVLEDSGAEGAVDEIDRGIDRFESLYREHDAIEHFDEDELVVRLRELKESIRNHYDLGPTLAEKLAQAVASEQYEQAAKLRDEIARRQSGGSH